MNTIINFFEENPNFYNYVFFILALFIFAIIARIINHFIVLSVEKSVFRRRDIAEIFVPFLILLFTIAGESIFLLLFNLTQEIAKSFYFFLNTQIIWACFWIGLAFMKLGIYKLPVSKMNFRQFYPSIKILLVLILFAVTITRNTDRIIATALGFVITFLLLRLSYVINSIPIFWVKTIPEEEAAKEEEEKIVSRWDSFNITLPYNIPKEVIDKAIKVSEKCVKESDNVGGNFSVLLKDLSERGIVIEVKYLVLVSTKMKETKHDILSRTLKSFVEHQISMSTS